MATYNVLKFDQLPLKRIHRRLIALDRRFRPALPTAAWLRSAVEACFWASFQLEEGRAIRGSIAYVSPNECVERIQLASRVKLAADEIRKLLPAVRPGCAALAAERSKLWGIALQIPYDAFFITIVGPGQLLLRCGERVLASLSGQALVELPDLHKVLEEMFPRLMREDLRNATINASRLMRQLGHGGAIAFVKELGSGLAPLHSIDAAGSRYGVRPRKTLAEETLEHEPENREMRARAAHEREHRTLAEALLLADIVHLTAIDGLALSDDLDGEQQRARVVCFGAKITSGEVPKRIELFEFGSSEPRSVSIDALGGTRHQSAARFAWSRSDALVLVVSQDGHCSLLGRCKRSGASVLRVVSGFEHAVPPGTPTLRFSSFAPASGSA